ncbi:MAG: zf-HC2 domain-containing protein [Candidatus Aminicenantes bacterium]|nr:zf-HC2 domain-containing protein [Candidatus Aminicenantes bacterium]
MRICKFEYLIDDYLLGKLSEDKRAEFEEHYFNCPLCFEKTVQRDELISVIKTKGSSIFQDIQVPKEAKRPSVFESVYAFLTPREWATAAVSAALLLIVVFGVLPNIKATSPDFYINEDRVRGPSITLISPVIEDMKVIPSQFRWQGLGEDVEYKIYIYNHDLMWSGTTKENFIVLSEEIKKLMISGEKYSWQVKAFSPEGILISVSSRVHFNISLQQ